MSLVHLIKTKKIEFNFNEINEILQLSEGYTRQLIAEMVKNKLLKQNKAKKDKRIVIYSLEWPLIRNYLLTGPSDFDEIILSIVDGKYYGYYVAIDNFKVVSSSETLMELTQAVGALKDDTTILITNADIPKNQLIIELS